MNRRRQPILAIVMFAAIASCGTNASSNEQSSLPSSTETDAAVETDPPGSSTTGIDLPATTTEVPSSQMAQLDQPAIWPAADTVFATPEAAAASFVADVLGVEPVLGDFLGGDSRSGEIQVFSPGDAPGADLVERGLLAVRMIGPNDGWFVIAATSAGVMIDSPQTLDRVAAGPLTLTGRARGFEGTVVVTAFRAGAADDVLDQVIARGGAMAALEPFSVTLDLSAGEPGDVIALVVRGDTGLDGDPGEFASLPVTIDDDLPETG